MRCKAENLHSDLHPPIHAGATQDKIRQRQASPCPGSMQETRSRSQGQHKPHRTRRKPRQVEVLRSDDRRGRDHSPVSATQGRFRRADDRSGCLHRRPPGAGDGRDHTKDLRAAWIIAARNTRIRARHQHASHVAHHGQRPMTPPRSPGRAVGGLPGNRDGLGDGIIAILWELLQGGSRLFLLPAESDCGAVPNQPAS